MIERKIVALKRIELKVTQWIQPKVLPKGTDRLRGWKWEQKRIVVFRRDGFLCRVCGEAAAEEVDHITPLESGGKDNLENLQSICKACHKIKNELEGIKRGRY
jgi:5-methylcytosine-specific restriction endonuclease McrA